MATFQDIWTEILKKEGTQNVDILASISEDGINHYLQEHHKNDSRVYQREIKKIFNTQTDSREFKVKIEISSPIQLQFPPYKNTTISGEYINKNKWYQLESNHEGPELAALKDDSNKIQVYCEQINITLTWPKLNGSGNWEFKLKPIKVFAEAFAILNNNQDGYYVTLIPTIVKVDIAKPALLISGISKQLKIVNKAELKLLDECQEKFTDLIVIAMNIVATEQTPKLVRNIRIPTPVIKDRPILPAILKVSENCLTVGAGIDKAKTESSLNVLMNQQMNHLKSRMEQDIEKAGGIFKMVSKNKDIPNNFGDLELKSQKEIDQYFVLTKQYIETIKSGLGIPQKIKSNNSKRAGKSVKAVKDAYAIGINEYFFDNIISSVIPAPKHDCTGWLDLAAVRGRACYWVKFFNPDVSINSDASLTGAVNVDIGGALEACIRKFWDCSWRWQCGSLTLAIKGRPNITIALRKSNGVSVYAALGGNLYFDTNLPFPFNKVIAALSSIMFNAIMGFINILLSLLSFYVIYPELTIPAQRTKLKLRNFDSFYYLRPVVTGNGASKNKFIGFKGGLIAEP